MSPAGPSSPPATQQLGFTFPLAIPHILLNQSLPHITNKLNPFLQRLRSEKISCMKISKVPRALTKWDIKTILKEDHQLSPITVYRLTNPSGQTIPTTKVYLPASEGQRLLEAGSISVNGVSCQTETCTHVPPPQVSQCFNCQGIGHTARTCKQKSPSCPRCAEAHRLSECSIQHNDHSNY